MRYSFGINTFRGFYEKLVRDFQSFRRSNESPEIAIDCAYTAWHLVDWTFKEFNKLNKNNYVKELFSKCPSLEVIRDIANGSKHYILDRYTPKIEDTKRVEGPFGPEFGYEFDRTRFMKDGRRLAFGIEMKKVIEFWGKYFQEEK